jgi:hypothetical protein
MKTIAAVTSRALCLNRLISGSAEVEARRAACDDNGSPERQAAEHRVRPLGDIKIAMV